MFYPLTRCRTTFRIEITHIPLLVNILFTIFLISWKSGRKSGFSTQHCFINSRSSSTLVISSDTVGRNGGISPDCTLFTISKGFKVRQRLLWSPWSPRTPGLPPGFATGNCQTTNGNSHKIFVTPPKRPFKLKANHYIQTDAVTVHLSLSFVNNFLGTFWFQAV